MSRQGTTELPVAIIGGGFSGTLLAVNLLRLGARVVLIERDEAHLAKGLAFGTRRPEHLLNVRAANMSAYPDNPNDFLRWMGFDTTDQANRFVPRLTYGHYLHEQLLSAMTAAPDRVRIRGQEALAVHDEGDAAVVTLAGGDVVRASAVVLALGNFPPPPVASFRHLLAPIDRRLAGIERRLGLADDQEAAPGFRGLLISVHGRLTAIERHLGISVDPGPGEEGPEKGEEGPEQEAE